MKKMNLKKRQKINCSQCTKDINFDFYLKLVTSVAIVAQCVSLLTIFATLFATLFDTLFDKGVLGPNFQKIK